LKKLTILLLLATAVLASATQVSKAITLKFANNSNIREYILGGKLKLPESVGITYCASDARSLTLTGAEQDIKAAEKAIADIDIQPQQVIVNVDFSVDGKTVSQPSIRTLVGFEANASQQSLNQTLKVLSVDVVPNKTVSGDIFLQTSIKVNDIVLIVPSGVKSGDSFSYSASKSAYYLRWSRSGKTIAEYPAPVGVKALGNIKVTLSFSAVCEGTL